MNDKYHLQLPLLKKYVSFEVGRCVEYGEPGISFKTTVEAVPQVDDDERDDETILADYRNPAVNHEGLPRLFWSVYGRTKAGFADALLDFDHCDHALQAMLALRKEK